jgi:isopenicillin N synthase-like dioxygenase
VRASFSIAKARTNEYQSKRFFKDLSEKEKKNVSMIPGSYNQGYVGVEQEQIRGVKVMKENFDFGDPNDDSINIWPPEAQLPGFRATSTDFHKVRNCVWR